MPCCSKIRRGLFFGALPHLLRIHLSTQSSCWDWVCCKPQPAKSQEKYKPFFQPWWALQSHVGRRETIVLWFLCDQSPSLSLKPVVASYRTEREIVCVEEPLLSCIEDSWTPTGHQPVSLSRGQYPLITGWSGDNSIFKSSGEAVSMMTGVKWCLITRMGQWLVVRREVLVTVWIMVWRLMFGCEREGAKGRERMCEYMNHVACFCSRVLIILYVPAVVIRFLLL